MGCWSLKLFGALFFQPTGLHCLVYWKVIGGELSCDCCFGCWSLKPFGALFSTYWSVLSYVRERRLVGNCHVIAAFNVLIVHICMSSLFCGL